jgi:hypothetical protein
MNNRFDELTKGMAESVTRRAALKKFGVGLAGMALAWFGLANKAAAADPYDPKVLCRYCINSCMGGGLSKAACRKDCQLRGFCLPPY